MKFVGEVVRIGLVRLYACFKIIQGQKTAKWDFESLTEEAN